MSSPRPRIGVTGPVRGGEAAWWFTRLGVWLAGGCALRITPRQSGSIEGIAGLVVGGGADVDPRLYGQGLAEALPRPRPPSQSRAQYALDVLALPLAWAMRKAAARKQRPSRDPKRDRLELRLIAQAVERGLPILGICRGAQLLNVHFGGTLHQSLTGFYVEDPEVRTVLPRKRIQLASGSRLERIMGGPWQRVNGLHRQAIDRAGRGLLVAARDRNGIIQGIEHERLPLVIGLQWHPEYLPQRAEQRAIFRALVHEARRISASAARPSWPSLAGAAAS